MTFRWTIACNISTRSWTENAPPRSWTAWPWTTAWCSIPTQVSGTRLGRVLQADPNHHENGRPEPGGISVLADNKGALGDDEERACAAVMDACLERLRQEGRLELLAALLSGDQHTFETFRCGSAGAGPPAPGHL